MASEGGSASTSSGYKRDLSLLNLIMLNCMGMIGSGWLFAAWKTTYLAGPFGSIFAWIIGGVIVLFISFAFMEISPMLPFSGGASPLGDFSHGKMTGFLAGWAAWLSDVMTPPVEALAVVTYSAYYIPSAVNSSGVLQPVGWVIAIVTMLLMFLINTRKVRSFGNATTGIMVWKWAIPGIAILGLLAFAYHPANFSSYGVFSSSGPLGIPNAIVLGGIVFSFLGFRGVVNMAGESKDPKMIGKSIIIAVLAVTALYILLDLTFVGALVWGKAGIVAGHWSSLSSSVYSNGPFAQEASEAGLGWLVILLLIDAVVSPGGTGMTYEAYPARIFQAMSKNGYAPKVFEKVNQKTGVPFNSLALSAAIGFIFLYRFPAWSLIIGILTTTLLVAYVIAPASVNVFRKTAPELERPFRLPGARIIGPIAFIMAFIAIYWSGWPLTGEVALVVLVGLVMYFYYHFKNGFSRKDVSSGIWYAVGLLVLAGESFIGPVPYGGNGTVPFPYDTVMVVLTAIGFYVWAQLSGWKTDGLENYIAEQNGGMSASSAGKK